MAVISQMKGISMLSIGCKISHIAAALDLVSLQLDYLGSLMPSTYLCTGHFTWAGQQSSSPCCVTAWSRDGNSYNCKSSPLFFCLPPEWIAECPDIRESEPHRFESLSSKTNDFKIDAHSDCVYCGSCHFIVAWCIVREWHRSQNWWHHYYSL